MRRGVIVIIIIFAAVLGLILFFALSHKIGVSEVSLLKGISLSPKSFQSADFADFFNKASELGNVVSWAGDWKQLNEANSAPNILVQLSNQYHYIPVIIIDFPNESDEDAFVNTVSNFVSQKNLRYIGIGNEINYDNVAVPFDKGIEIFNRTYDAIKSKSLDAIIFTIFQYERFNGLNGGLFGQENDVANSQWNLLREVSKADAIGFTTYPALVYKNPDEIPSNYYSAISSHTSKPIIFTEVGWFKQGPLGWESSEDEQTQFIYLFFNQTKSIKSSVKIWSFLYDQNVRTPFNFMGLLEKNQTTSPAFEAWVKSK